MTATATALTFVWLGMVLAISFIETPLKFRAPGMTHALGVVARSRGMTSVARRSGLTREALYQALRADSKPRFDTISRVCKALGVRLVAQPAQM